MKGAYYNEFDPGAAAWLRELMHEGLIPSGDVDERSIRDVSADDLRGYVQCHFFAGIGVWPYALRRAGWEDDRPVGTGSCPCQPFSAAGKGKGFKDPRHLWPDFYRIIRGAYEQGQRWAYSLFGEQAPTAGAWIDLVRSDLEALGHAFGSPDIPAAGFGGAHIRQRFYWVADAHNAERWTDLAPRNLGDWPSAGRVEGPGDVAERGEAGWLADADGGNAGAERQQRGGQQRQQPQDGSSCGLGHAERFGLRGRGSRSPDGAPGGMQGADWQRKWLRSEPWSAGSGDADWLYCSDELWRPVEPGTFPLVTEAPARLGRLRGYGNALDSETATNFIAAYMEAAGINAAGPYARVAA